MESRLEELLKQACKGVPTRLADAMIYGTMNGGKRLRPFLHLEAAKLFSGDEDTALDIACAIEFVHCYSLIHDDMPAMDDSPLRRGKPSVHKAFDESTALLAGTALYGAAFDVLACLNISSETKIKLISDLVTASGSKGMMGGQQLDMDAQTAQHAFSESEVTRLQNLKTGAMFDYSLTSAATAFSSTKEDVINLLSFAQAFGLVFQITDDLLDVEGSLAVVGKPVNVDAPLNKASFVTILGIDNTKAKAQQLISQAKQSLEPYGNNAHHLISAADFLITRTK